MHVVNILVYTALNCLETKYNLITCLSVILLSYICMYKPYINIGSRSFLLEHGILRCPSVLEVMPLFAFLVIEPMLYHNVDDQHK